MKFYVFRHVHVCIVYTLIVEVKHKVALFHDLFAVHWCCYCL